MSKAIEVANPLEVADASGVVRHGRVRLFKMWFNQNPQGSRDLVVYVWADSFESAFEVAVEFLDDEGYCGYFADLGIPDLMRAADDLGIKWQKKWSNRPDYDDLLFQKIFERAEEGLTLVGHTSLKCGQYVRSDAWGGDDVDGREPEWSDVVVASLSVARRQYWPDPEDWEDQLRAMTPRGRELAERTSASYSRRRRTPPSVAKKRRASDEARRCDKHRR